MQMAAGTVSFTLEIIFEYISVRARDSNATHRFMYFSS